MHKQLKLFFNIQHKLKFCILTNHPKVVLVNILPGTWCLLIYQIVKGVIARGSQPPGRIQAGTSKRNAEEMFTVRFLSRHGFGAYRFRDPCPGL